jgi:hypothetical protein
MPWRGRSDCIYFWKKSILDVLLHVRLPLGGIKRRPPKYGSTDLDDDWKVGIDPILNDGSVRLPITHLSKSTVHIVSRVREWDTVEGASENLL